MKIRRTTKRQQPRLTRYIERPVPSTGESESYDEYVELEIEVEFDEGCFYGASLEDGSNITLTDDEIFDAEEAWRDNEQAKYEDAMEARGEAARERDRGLW